MRAIVRWGLCAVLLALGCAAGLHGQIINTVVGNFPASDGVKAREMPLVFSRAVAADQNGLIYIADDGSGTVRRIDPSTGIATVLAGGGTAIDDLIPVTGRSAFFDYPIGLAFGPDGNLYIVDDSNARVRMRLPDGRITTVAGNGVAGYSGDGGPATRAQLSLPSAIAFDGSGNLYITDRGNTAIRKVDARTGIITTIAGGPPAINTGDGIPATQAWLYSPWGLAVDAAGDVYVADSGGQVVRKVEMSTGLIRTIAGTGVAGSTGDGGPATAAQLYAPQGLAFAPNGDLYIGQSFRVRKVKAGTGEISTVVGGGTWILADSYLGTDVYIPSSVYQLCVTASNKLLMALAGDGLVAQLDLSTGTFNVVAGSLFVVGDNGPALNAALALPQNVAVDSADNLYIADTYHHRIRRVAPGSGGIGTGTITTFAGSGYENIMPDGKTAATTSVSFPRALLVDSGTVYFADGSSVIRAVGADGLLTTVAGMAYKWGYSGDKGPATAATLDTPRSLLFDSAKNLYIADSGNNCIRKVDTKGIITTFAGTSIAGYFGDGGPATAARLNDPRDLVLDGRGGLLVADWGNHRIRRIDLYSGIITTFAGTGRSATLGDGGAATLASIYKPTGLAVDGLGNIYVTGPNQIRRIDTAGKITRVAGVGDPGSLGDNDLATLAHMSTPVGILMDRFGNIIFADSLNHTIRRVSGTTIAPILVVSPTSLTFSAIQGGTSPSDQSVQISTTNLVGASWTAAVRLDNGTGWLSVRPASGATPAVLQVSVNSSSLAAGTYTGTISISASGAATQSASIRLTVAAGGTPKLALDQVFLTFRATEGSSNPSPQVIAVSNAGGGTLNWSASVQTSTGGSWLAVSPASGTGAGSLAVSATVGSLFAGVYQGLVTARNTATGETSAVSVAFIVDKPLPVLSLSHSGALFRAVAGATFVPAETVQVVNTGQGSMTWQASVVSLSSVDWLKLSPSSGTSSGGSTGAGLTLSASPGTLVAGLYDALVTISSSGVTNSPQVVLARLIVQESSAAPVANIRPVKLVDGVLMGDPHGLALVASAGGSARGLLEITTSGGFTASGALTFVVSASTSEGGSWLSVSPQAGSLRGSSQSAIITVEANPAQLAAGAYRGKVSIAFNTGVSQDVSVLLVVAPAGVRAAGQVAEQAAPDTQAESCIASQQYPVHTALVNNFALPSGWATPVMVRVLDNCGAAVTRTTVVCTFSNGDQALMLNSLGDGLYTGMWNPGKAGAVNVTAVATGAGLAVGRAEAIAGNVGAAGVGGRNTPVIYRNGAVHGASFERFAPLAPGQIFSLFGTNLSPATASAQAKPLPTELSGVRVKLGSTNLPLYYSATGQINAQVPFEAAPRGTLPLVVTSGGTASPPELVTLTATRPGIFTVTSSGSGAGVITDPDGVLISASNAAARGSVVIVYATGLGATNPPVATGVATPSGLFRTVDAVSAYVGGVPATVEFAGLTPDFVGLYQVNVRIPNNAPTGSTVEFYLEQSQVTSNKVTLAVK